MAFPPNAGGVSLADINTQLKNSNQLLAQLIAAVQSIFPVAGVTTGSASAGGATLPSNPQTFLTVTLPSGAQGKIPVYNP